MTRRPWFALLAIIICLLPAMLFAQDPPPTPPPEQPPIEAGAEAEPEKAEDPAAPPAETDSGDTAWVLTSTALVLFMTLPGLALFYAGLVRRKNMNSLIMQCFGVTAVISFVWPVLGYTLAYGAPGGGFFGGFDYVFLSGITKDSVREGHTIPEALFVMYQMTFAIITPALFFGSFAERIRFLPCLLFSALWVILVFAPVMHWTWGGGWLTGIQDLGGGLCVHVAAGASGLVAAVIIGKRIGWPDKDMPPCNLPMCATGAAMLWVGWFGFNGGSPLGANASAGSAILATHLSAAAATVSWLAYEWIREGKPTMIGCATACVAGLVCSTPSAGSVGPWGAITLGFIGGLVCYFAVSLVKDILKIDDSLDVFAVHGVGGMYGMIVTGIFCSPNLGILSGWGFSEGIDGIGAQLWLQTKGVLATAVYAGTVSAVLLLIMKFTIGLRVTAEQEEEGLDTVLHGGS